MATFRRLAAAIPVHGRARRFADGVMYDLFDLLGIKGLVVAAGAGGVCGAVAASLSCANGGLRSRCACRSYLPGRALFQGDWPPIRPRRRHHHACRRLPDRRLRHVDLGHPVRICGAQVQAVAGRVNPASRNHPIRRSLILGRIGPQYSRACPLPQGGGLFCVSDPIKPGC